MRTGHALSIRSSSHTPSILEIPFEIATGILFSLHLVAVNLQPTVLMPPVIVLVSFCLIARSRLKYTHPHKHWDRVTDHQFVDPNLDDDSC